MKQSNWHSACRSWNKVGFLILISCLCSAERLSAQHKPAADPAMNTYIDHLMAQMTLEEKIGQLNLLSSGMAVTGPTISDHFLQDIKAGRCGGIFNAYTPAFARKLQEAAVNHTRLHIPLIFGFDVIHGHKTIFPIPLAMASSWDTVAIAQAARIAADEASADGLNWVYSPMVDITRDPRWGRVMEGAGEDPWLGSAIARAYVRGYQGNDLSADSTVMACVKHFALYGAAVAGRDYNAVDMSHHQMFQYYLPPYKAALDAGAGSVMTSFNTINGVPATANPWLLKALLREQWGFDGLVATDYNAVSELIAHGVAKDKAEATRLAINAGSDMDMMGFAYIETLQKLVDSGQVSTATLDQAVRKVLEAKYKLGLFADPYRYIQPERAEQEIMRPENLAFAREMARKSMVLLKNEDQLLPLSKKGTIAIIGPLAKDQRDMIGAWSGAGDWHKAVSFYAGLQQAIGDSAKVLYARGANITDDTALIRQLNANGGDLQPASQDPEALITEAVTTARQADVVVLFLGESQGMSGEAASRADIRLLENQRRLLKAIDATGKPVVLVLSSGRPLVLRQVSREADAIVQSWFLGTEAGHALTDVLFGLYNPSGKLTMSFPYSVGQIPVYYNHLSTGRPRNPEVKYTSKYLTTPNAPLYPFGYGLSYTHFTYDHLQLDQTTLHPGDRLRVQVTVTNDGNYDGTTTAQLYIQDKVASVAQPVKELKGYQQVFLKKGESKTLHFSLKVSDLKFYGAKGRWIWEPGAFGVYIGPNSRDVLSADFTLARQ